MKLTKAIEINSFNVKDRIPINELDELRAINLGIEALLYLRHARQDGAHHAPALLPGETPEGESP